MPSGTDVVEEFAQSISQLGYLGSLHIAIMACLTKGCQVPPAPPSSAPLSLHGSFPAREDGSGGAAQSPVCTNCEPRAPSFPGVVEVGCEHQGSGPSVPPLTRGITGVILLV